MSSASARFTEYSRTNERACRWDDQRRRRNMRLSTVLQRRTTRRLGAGEKENGITPAVGTRRSAESLWTLFDRRFLFHFFLSSFFFFFFSNFTGRSFPSCSTLFLPSSFSFRREEYEMTERTIPPPRTSSRSIVFIPLSSVPRCLGPRGWLDGRRHSRELIEPFHSTRRFTIEPIPILSIGGRRSVERI